MLHPDTAVHTPFADIAKSARRPHAGMGNKVQPSSTITNHIGRFRVPAIVDNVDNGVFLPPAPMLQLFDEQFTAVLYRRVQCPMAETVELCRLENGKRLAEELCAALPLNQIIGHMSNEAAWHEGRLARHFLCRPVQRAPPSDAGGSTVVSDEEEDEGEDEDKVMACASPRIEAISDERLAEMGFVVREGWSSATEKDDSSSSAEEEDSEAVDMDEPEVDEYDLDGPDRDSSPFSAGPELPELPSLKRKLSEEEEELPGAVPLRSRLGSGQTSSHSSSGETVNTPLVTPDDSPDLMACAIHLAVDEDADATMDGSGSAPQEGLPAPHPAPASPSSSLGKRKLKDDAIDEALDGSERQRLRRSTSVASSKSVVDEGEEDGENKDVDEIKREDELAVPEKPPFEKSPLADHSGATTESTPMASSEEADTRSGDMTPSDPTASTTASAPSSPPIKPVPVYAVRTEPAPKLSIEEHPSNGHKALDDDLDLEDDFDDEDYEGYTTSDSGDDPGDPIPFVPSPMTEFGPRAKDVMQRAWYAACAPLRQCECRICVRAKANELSFSFMGLGTWEDADAMLRIA
jgi:hypothetical protein